MMNRTTTMMKLNLTRKDGLIDVILQHWKDHSQRIVIYQRLRESNPGSKDA